MAARCVALGPGHVLCEPTHSRSSSLCTWANISVTFFCEPARRFRLYQFCGLLTLCLISGTLRAAEHVVEIETTTGRVFSAEVDPTSGTKQLWLRTARSGMYVYRPIQWSAVA